MKNFAGMDQRMPLGAGFLLFLKGVCGFLSGGIGYGKGSSV